MPDTPIYVKKRQTDPRPTDPMYFHVTASGLFQCRNHEMFQSDVRVEQFPKELATHQDRCLVDLPRLPVSALEFIVGFFDHVFQRYSSEAIVLLFWNWAKRRYKLVVPEQTATVWESNYGARFPLDVSYEIPVGYLGKHQLIGDIHSHGDHGSMASHTDHLDEVHRDGVHIIVGNIQREPPSFYAVLAVDGARFSLSPEQIFAGYRQRRTIVPRRWINNVKVKVDRPKTYYTSSGNYH
jgi:hypothetical protein